MSQLRAQCLPALRQEDDFIKKTHPDLLAPSLGTLSLDSGASVQAGSWRLPPCTWNPQPCTVPVQGPEHSCASEELFVPISAETVGVRLWLDYIIPWTLRRKGQCSSTKCQVTNLTDCFYWLDQINRLLSRLVDTDLIDTLPWEGRGQIWVADIWATSSRGLILVLKCHGLLSFHGPCDEGALSPHLRCHTCCPCNWRKPSI